MVPSGMLTSMYGGASREMGSEIGGGRDAYGEFLGSFIPKETGNSGVYPLDLISDQLRDITSFRLRTPSLGVSAIIVYF